MIKIHMQLSVGNKCQDAASLLKWSRQQKTSYQEPDQLAESKQQRTPKVCHSTRHSLLATDTVSTSSAKNGAYISSPTATCPKEASNLPDTCSIGW